MMASVNCQLVSRLARLGQGPLGLLVGDYLMLTDVGSGVLIVGGTIS